MSKQDSYSANINVGKGEENSKDEADLTFQASSPEDAREQFQELVGDDAQIDSVKDEDTGKTTKF